MKKVFIILALVVAFILGLWLANVQWLPWKEEQVSSQASILLERIEKVTKLITVDGYFSEVYDYKDYYGYDWPIFRKKALIRVRAKVSAGYDLDHLDIEAIPDKKTITIHGLPEPKILSIDHDLDYYDLTEGTFNSFSNTDLTKLNQQAKAYIEASAAESNLLRQAEDQGKEMLQVLRFMVEGAGWLLIIEDPSFEPTGSSKPKSTLN